MSKNKDMNEKLNEGKMVDEGGLASEEDLLHGENKADDTTKEEHLQKKKMDDEGAMPVDTNLFNDENIPDENEREKK